MKFWFVWHEKDSRGVLHVAAPEKVDGGTGAATSFEFRSKEAGRRFVYDHVTDNRVRAQELLTELSAKRWMTP